MAKKAVDNVHFLEPSARVCKGCGQSKSLDNFHLKNIGKFGRAAVCTSCHKNAWRTAHPKKPKKPWTAKEKQQYRLSRPAQNMYYRAKSRAKLSGMQFNITLDDIEVPRFCPILGIALSVAPGRRGNLERGNSPSIDRIDNSKGYIKGNVIVISYRANCIKRDASLLELQRIADFYTKLEAGVLLTRQCEMQY